MKLYETLADEIKNEILLDRLKEGDKLLSIREFSKSKEISHVTAVNVYKKLERDGLIVSTAKGFHVLGNASEYVNDYYLRQIEQAFLDILTAQKKLGFTKDQLFQHLQLLYTIGGAND